MSSFTAHQVHEFVSHNVVTGIGNSTIITMAVRRTIGSSIVLQGRFDAKHGRYRFRKFLASSGVPPQRGLRFRSSSGRSRGRLRSDVNSCSLIYTHQTQLRRRSLLNSYRAGSSRLYSQSRVDSGPLRMQGTQAMRPTGLIRFIRERWQANTSNVYRYLTA